MSPGQFLVSQLLSQGPSLGLSLVFVWARRGGALEPLPPELRLTDLRQLPDTGVHLVVEVAHPCVVQEHGEDILRHADLMVGSPSALADADTERRLRAAVARGGHTLYVPRGALWGCEDIARLDRTGTLQSLTVSLTVSPASLRPQGQLRDRLVAAVAAGTVTELYRGPLRPLCALAPNNTNAMAAAALAAPGLGFDRVTARLLAQPSVPDWHLLEVEVTAVTDGGRPLTVTSSRRNPAGHGDVTGRATLQSFWISLQDCTGHGGCVKFC
ncbi:aspartate dehydrogenase domain-containing protein-like [Poecile atricapillus]|uniref:aspartate dehydrogenase domain-containing protein-like n=1 Tax=Poecile atricapillus TaxID=48891 RepID=UPI002738BB1E|nr:aspartate dehydrogenase domain-containing protein-like [Poecile atricapillus]